MAPFLLANFLATLYFVPYLYGGRSPPYLYRDYQTGGRGPRTSALLLRPRNAPSGSGWARSYPLLKKSQCCARPSCVLLLEQARCGSILVRSDDPWLDFAASDTHFLALTGLFAPTFASRAFLDSPSLPRSTPLRPIYKPHLV